jgi:hypothetical protein
MTACGGNQSTSLGTARSLRTFRIRKDQSGRIFDFRGPLMPRFFFHEKDDPDTEDLNGAELKNEAAARQEAILRLRRPAQEDLQPKDHVDAIEVENETGETVIKVGK